MVAFRTMVNNSFQESFNSTFLRNGKSCQNINYFFSPIKNFFKWITFSTEYFRCDSHSTSIPSYKLRGARSEFKFLERIFTYMYFSLLKKIKNNKITKQKKQKKLLTFIKGKQIHRIKKNINVLIATFQIQSLPL